MPNIKVNDHRREQRERRIVLGTGAIVTRGETGLRANEGGKEICPI